MSDFLRCLREQLSQAFACETEVFDISNPNMLSEIIEPNMFSMHMIDQYIANKKIFDTQHGVKYIPYLIDEKYLLIKLTGLQVDNAFLYEKVKFMIHLSRENIRYKEDTPIRKSDTRTFFLNKILDYQNEEEAISIISWNYELGYNLELPRVTCVISIRNAYVKNAKVYDNIKCLKNSILDKVENHHFITGEDIVTYINSEQLVICKALAIKDMNKYKELFSQFFNDIGQYVLHKHGLMLAYGVGLLHRGYQRIKNSFEEAVFAMETSTLPGPAFIEDYMLEYIVNKIPLQVFEHFLREKYRLIKNRQELIDTIDALVKNNMNVGQAASAIFVHKNTLIFRIRTIKNILKLDPFRRENDRITLLLLHHYIRSVTTNVK